MAGLSPGHCIWAQEQICTGSSKVFKSGESKVLYSSSLCPLKASPACISDRRESWCWWLPWYSDGQKEAQTRPTVASIPEEFLIHSFWGFICLSSSKTENNTDLPQRQNLEVVADSLSLPSCTAWVRRVDPGCPLISKWETKAGEWPVLHQKFLSTKSVWWPTGWLVPQITPHYTLDSEWEHLWLGGASQPYFLQSERRWASFWHVHLLVKRWVEHSQGLVAVQSSCSFSEKAAGTWAVLGAALQPSWVSTTSAGGCVSPLLTALVSSGNGQSCPWNKSFPFISWKGLSNLQQSIFSPPGEGPDTLTRTLGLQRLGQQGEVRLIVTPAALARSDWGAIQLWTWWSLHQLCSSVNGQQNQDLHGQHKWVVQLSLALLGEEGQPWGDICFSLGAQHRGYPSQFVTHLGHAGSRVVSAVCQLRQKAWPNSSGRLSIFL